MNNTKTCTKCKQLLSIDNFNKHKLTKSGFRGECRSCQAKYNATFYSNSQNAEGKRRYMAKYCRRPEVKARGAEYGKTPEQRELWAKRYLKWKSNPENIAKKAQYDIRYYHTPKGRAVHLHSKHTRRQIYTQITDITNGWLKWLYASTEFCIYCGVKMIDSGRDQTSKTLDHIKPLSKDGKHMMSNVRVICWRCNSAKRALEEVEHLERNVFSGIYVENIVDGIIIISI